MLEEEESIEVHIQQAEIPSVYTSTDMLTEAFRVLVKNALEAIRAKAKEDGAGGQILVESRMSDDGSDIEILIQDTGTGIKPENLDKIFELRWSTKEVGMGFGLFWTKDYIEGLGGSIDVDSVWGEKTNFLIKLPPFLNN